MGIGLHGGAVETIKWFLAQGAQVVATDLKKAQELGPSLEKLKGLKNLEIITGIHRTEDFVNVDLVVKNPAVRWDNQYVKLALDKKIPVEMDSSLFFRHCPSRNIIGVTGTKGKTTTALLIFEILKAAGKKAVLVGVGQESVMGKLKEIDEKTWVVFELSSWRLSALKRQKVSPSGAVMVNFFQDHLNYYQNMAEYAADKKALFEFQKKEDWLVVEEETLSELSSYSHSASAVNHQSRVGYFSEKEKSEEREVFVRDGKIKFSWEGQIGQLGSVDELKLRGRHNWKNVLAAAAAGLFLGIEPEKIWQAVSRFSGAPHRLELVKEIGGVAFYNDTTATTPESGRRGIQAFDQPLHLIAGGSNKNLDLKIFADEIAGNEKVKKVYLLDGAATEKLRGLIEKAGGQDKLAGIFDNLKAAVVEAATNAVSGETVLLSPGCASFGMFDNEFDRGGKFRQAVEGLRDVTQNT